MLSNTRKVLVAATALAAVTWFAAPAAAQRGRGGDQGRGSSQGQGQGQSQGGNPRSGGERRAAQPRQDAPRPQPQQQQVRPEVQRPQPSQPAQGQRYGGAQPRQVQPQAQAPQRFSGSAQGRQQPAPQQMQRPQPQQQMQQRQAVPRQVQPNRPSAPAPAYRNTAPQYGSRGPQVYQAPRNYGGSRYYGSYRYTTYPYVVHRPVFVQPYYAFRPRLTLSFGIHVGYGVSYPFSYWDPNAFYNYNVGIRPGYNVSTYYNRVGGLSFEIDPWDAGVFIDGEYVGIAADFAPDQMPLTLLAGRHRVDLRADGFSDVSFEITVVAGQVIPYQGTLPYGYGR